MLKRNSRQQRVVIRRVLVKLIVAHENHLDLFHVILLVHLEGTPIHNLLKGGLAWACIELILVQVFIDLVRELVTLFEALMIGTDEYDTHIQLLKANVYVEHVLLCAARDADRCPCFSVSHRAESHHEVEDYSHVFSLDLIEFIREYINDVEVRNQHAKR